ncbi:MAG TPA: glycosyltransferase [Gallicola sp.]|nr:glycosyltransferase [Gallicola sp.]
MKVLQINSVCGIGSTGRIAIDIHNILIDQGHESYIAYGRGLPKNCDDAIRIGTKIDNYTHVAKTRLLDKHGFGSKRATKEFVKEIKKIDPDIIHLHNIHGYYINIEILFNYLKEANKPVIWTLHDCWSFTGHCSHFDYIGCKKWKTGCFDCPQKQEYPKSVLIDNSEWNYNKKKEIFMGVDNMMLVTPSNWLSNLVGKSFLKDYRIEVINNGIELSFFKPTDNEFRKKYELDDKFIILGVASIWTQSKGINYFLELSTNLKEDEVIVLVGLSNKQLKEIPENIIGISRTNNVEELADIYSSADIFVNPTLEDNFPTVNLEALACGTPVITFETGGSPESINNKTGMVVKERSSVKLYENISNIRVSEKHSYIKECVDRAIKKYDRKLKYEEYISLYNNLVKSN